MRETEQTAPMHRLVRRLRDEHGFRFEEADAIELFAKDGLLHTVAYAPLVRSLEAWEVDVRCREDLRNNLPNAKIRFVDTWKEIRKYFVKRFNFIVVDTPCGVYGELGEHCEHFGLLPHVFKMAASETVIVLGVCVEPYDVESNGEWMRRRIAYYYTSIPEKLELQHVVTRYAEICRENGVRLKWSFFQRRHHYLEYFVMGIEKREIEAIEEERCGSS